MLILSFISIICSLISLLRKVANEIVLLREPFFLNYLKERSKSSTAECLKEA